MEPSYTIGCISLGLPLKLRLNLLVQSLENQSFPEEIINAMNEQSAENKEVVPA